jgi:DNA-binding transcriptional MerR regulator
MTALVESQPEGVPDDGRDAGREVVTLTAGARRVSVSSLDVASGAPHSGQNRVWETSAAPHARHFVTAGFYSKLWYTLRRQRVGSTSEHTADRMDIPNRSLFKPPEVCEIAQVQPYVLRSWEAEFPDLGVAKAGSGQRMYRRADVRRVLRIKELLFVEGLTLAGVRRRLEEEDGGRASEGETGETSLTELLGADARERIADVRQGLRWILDLLAGNGDASLKRAPALFAMERAAAPAARPKKPAVKKKKARR